MKLAIDGISLHAGPGNGAGAGGAAARTAADGPQGAALRLVLERLGSRVTVHRDLAEDSALILCGGERPDLARILKEAPKPPPDGYSIRALPRQNAVALTAGNGRGLLYAARMFSNTVTTAAGELEWNTELQESPAYPLRSWLYFDVASPLDTVCREVIPRLAQDLRLNTVMYSTFKKGTVGPQVSLDAAFPGHERPFRDHEAEVNAARGELSRFTDAALRQGLDVHAGWDVLDFPDYVYEFIVAHEPRLLARGFKGSSDWPPYEWMERPKYCPSEPRLWNIWQDAVEEFLTVHPRLEGLVLSFYDGNPLGCGCPKCEGYSYGSRYRDAIMRTNQVVLRHGKKLTIFDWLPGGLSARPGYGAFWDASREYIDANANITMASWETQGDFCMGHPPHPEIGRYRNQIAGFQLWPEYRGWGKVPDWMVRHMSERVRLFRQKPLKGFFAIEGNLDDRVNAVNFHAYGELCWNPEADPSRIETAYCEREFGKGGAALAPVLARSWDCKKDYLYVHDVKFNGHSHLEYDLRTWESVYVRYDSGAFFPDLEKRLELSEQSLGRIMSEKDRGVSSAQEMMAGFQAIAERFSDPDRRLIGEQLRHNIHYSRLWRGFARAFFNLKHLGAHESGMGAPERLRAIAAVKAGALEMAEAYAELPRVPSEGKHAYYEQGFPWSSPDLENLIGDLDSAARICQGISSGAEVLVAGGGLSSQFLDHLFIPHDRAEGAGGVPWDGALEGIERRKVVVIDRYATSLFDRNASRLLDFVSGGGSLVLNDPDCQVLDGSKLPGSLRFNVCQYRAAKVIERDHPVMKGFRDVGAEPIHYFGSTSAYMEEAGFNPGLRQYGVGDHGWSALTYPGMFFERKIGKGTILVNLVSQNRSIYLRALAYLAEAAAPE